MSGITKSFKVPKLIKRTKNHHGLPDFTCKNSSNLRELGAGSFGSIHLAHYGVECKKVVVEKLCGKSDDAKRRFLKEAEMQHKFYVGTLKLFIIPDILLRQRQRQRNTGGVMGTCGVVELGQF